MTEKQFRIALVLIGFATFILIAFAGVKIAPVIRSKLRQDELQTNYQKWLALKITHYRFRLNIICLCQTSENPVEVEVRGAQPIAAVDSFGKSVMIADNADSALNAFVDWQYLFTIDGVFSFATSSFADPSSSVNIEYDTKFGFPSSISVCGDPSYSDNCVYIKVNHFEVLQ